MAGTIARARRRTTIVSGSDAASDHQHPGLGRAGSIFIPNFGLGRYSSTTGGGGTASRYSNGRSPSAVENGLMPPSGHSLGKAPTAPAALGVDGGDHPPGHIWSGRVPRAAGVPLRPGPPAFWQRRTGSGSRKVDLSQHLGSTNEEALGSAASTPGVHSVVEDTVAEEEEGEGDEKAGSEAGARSSNDRDRTRQNTHEHEQDLRTMLARHHIEEHLHPQTAAATAVPSSPKAGSVRSHVSFATPTPGGTSMSADEADAPPTVKGVAQPKPRMPTFAPQESATSLFDGEGGGGGAGRYFTPPETPQPGLDARDEYAYALGGGGRSSGAPTSMLRAGSPIPSIPSLRLDSPLDERRQLPPSP